MRKIKVYYLSYKSKVEEIVEGEVKSVDYIESEGSYSNVEDLIEAILSITARDGFITKLDSYYESFYDEEDYQELKDKLNNAWGYLDNVCEHLEEMKTDIDNLSYDLDEALDDAESGRDECEE